jgi:hypothetical protein
VGKQRALNDRVNLYYVLLTEVNAVEVGVMKKFEFSDFF